ncbi:hypothetical protein LJC46_09140 [Desulfovibrio sp. OttesenSCG-928-G15]|nr:hypothetical protein [Desulfovibrio sp. OttesenSCG-928-G15]
MQYTNEHEYRTTHRKALRRPVTVAKAANPAPALAAFAACGTLIIFAGLILRALL